MYKVILNSGREVECDKVLADKKLVQTYCLTPLPKNPDKQLPVLQHSFNPNRVRSIYMERPTDAICVPKSTVLGSIEVKPSPTGREIVITQGKGTNGKKDVIMIDHSYQAHELIKALQTIINQ